MSTPRINPNDPKWTAYVLGELDEAEVAAVDQLLAASPDARALVEDIRTATMALEEAMASEPLVLTPAQRAAIRREADVQPARGFRWLPMRWAWGVGVVTVSVVAIAVVQRAPAPQPVQPSTIATPAPNAPVVTDAPASIVADAKAPPVPPVLQQPTVQTPRATAAPVAAADATTPPTPGNTTVSGVVRDSSGAILPGVTVTATNTATGAVTSTQTDAQGRYSFVNMPAGSAYRITTALRGFATGLADLQANAGIAQQQDFTMPVGSLAETVTVSGEMPIVDVSNARQVFAPGLGNNNDGQPVTRQFDAASAPQSAASGFTGRGGGGAGRAGAARYDPSVARSIPVTPERRGTESYASVSENTFVRASQQPLATFSIDVDTASYSNVRRFLTQNQLPPADAVRIEELVNYFTYDYPRVSGQHPIGATMAVTAAPWNPRNRLVRIGIKAREIDTNRRPPSNLVFLIDVSGSMDTPQKLPLVKSGLKLLVDQLGENDRVSIVVYAGASGLVLAPTRGDQKEAIARALDDLQPGGSTNGAAGLRLAYNEATAGFIRGGTNRVILMTDGDFNVGITSQDDLTRLIEDRAKSGVFLSVLGFGMGNLKDSTMERLADTGNGHYAYIDSLNEARKVLVEQMSGTLVTVAKDVKMQVDFNPGKVEAYRLIGYENRVLRPEDFNNDLKDAGDMGAGHTVTALFEVVPRGGTVPGPSIDPSVFQPIPRDTPPPASNSNDMLVLRIRYKLPDAATSTRMDLPLADRNAAFSAADADFRFAASVAAFGMVLKNSQYRGEATLPWVLDTATSSRGADRGGYRDEFISLVQKAIALQGVRGRD